MGFFVAAFFAGELLVEAAALFLRIVQFGEGVGDFKTGGVDFEAFGEGGFVGLVLGERRNFTGKS